MLYGPLMPLLHSVPGWVAGDWLVEGDGGNIAWHFMGSRLIAGIDSHFDYQRERKATLETIKRGRRHRSDSRLLIKRGSIVAAWVASCVLLAQTPRIDKLCGIGLCQLAAD